LGFDRSPARKSASNDVVSLDEFSKVYTEGNIEAFSCERQM
jgi:hypothetical protein